MAADPNIEVMGQKLILPSTVHGTVGLFGALAAVVLCVFFIANGLVVVATSGNPKNVEKMFGSFFSAKNFTKDGGRTDIEEDTNDSKLVQFWSPSAETQEDLARESPTGKLNADDSWQITTEEHVDDFEKELWNHFGGGTQKGPLNGLRRYREVGRGHTNHKRGWWWILNMRTDFDSRELAKFYFSYWGKSKAVYVEELNSKARYE